MSAPLPSAPQTRFQKFVEEGKAFIVKLYIACMSFSEIYVDLESVLNIPPARFDLNPG